MMFPLTPKQALPRRRSTGSGEMEMSDRSDDDSYDIEMYFEVLREDPPFKRYVSRGDTPDVVDIPDPHSEADSAIYRAIRMVRSDRAPRFQPVLGNAGMGKTHLYWVLKDREADSPAGPYRAVYVPSPPSPVRVPLHFYACLVDELGDLLFGGMADVLLDEYGELQGLIRKRFRLEDIMRRAAARYPGVAADAVKVLVQYRLAESKKNLARRWLLGEALSPEELAELDVRTYLEDDDITMATFRLLLEGSDRPIVLFIDEMEGPYNTHGEEGERQFLEVIKRVYNECTNVCIVASCLSEIWDRIYSIADGPLRSRMEVPIALQPFSREHVARFVRETMELYWDDKNLEVPPNPYFPLTEKDLDAIFDRSRGVPREAIRQLIARMDEILFGRKVTEVKTTDYVVKLTPSVVIGSIVRAIQLRAESNGLKIQLQAVTGRTKRESTAMMEITDGVSSRTFAVEVPNVKNWNRSAGVAAYYSARRLKRAIEAGMIDMAVIAIPEGTSGAKFEAMKQELGDRLIELVLDYESAAQLAESTNEDRVPTEQIQMFDDLVARLKP